MKDLSPCALREVLQTMKMRTYSHVVTADEAADLVNGIAIDTDAVNGTNFAYILAASICAQKNGVPTTTSPTVFISLMSPDLRGSPPAALDPNGGFDNTQQGVTVDAPTFAAFTEEAFPGTPVAMGRGPWLIPPGWFIRVNLINQANPIFFEGQEFIFNLAIAELSLDILKGQSLL